MVTPNQSSMDTARARLVWAAYKAEHNLSEEKGKVAAIEPESGHVWINDTGIDLADQLESEGVTAPVYLVRVGADHFVRKGRR